MAVAGPGPILDAEPFPARSPGYLSNPYAHLALLRDQGSCHVDPGSGRWFLLSYDHVDIGLAAITRGEPIEADRRAHFPDNPFAADGTAHTGPRRVVTPAFTNRAVQELRGRAQQIVDEVLAGREDGGELRVVDELGFRLPYQLTCDILGVPDVDHRDELRDWTWRSLELVDVFLTQPEVHANLEAAGNLAMHLHEVISWKRSHLADDLLSTIIRATDEGEVMTPNQLVPFVHTLYLAGMHTTVNQIALSLLALLEHRDQWDLLRADPLLLDNAVEELLRFEPTAQYMRRTGSSDVDLGGDLTIPAGTEVVCWIASANRDPARWGETADRLDITRSDARHHLAFGKGPHVCLGSWLARLELQTVLATVVGRYPNTRLVEQELEWGSNFIRGPRELVLELVP
jgi:cytochrome P450